jgi:hypothetical protein
VILWRGRVHREIYGVRSFMNVDPCRDRMILGDRLVPMDDDHRDWSDCLLANTPYDLRVRAWTYQPDQVKRPLRAGLFFLTCKTRCLGEKAAG